MFSEKKKAEQAEFWIAADKVASPAQRNFYAKLEETLESFGFAAKVRALCAPAYDKSGGARRALNRGFTLKWFMLGFFENLPRERPMGVAASGRMPFGAFFNYD